MNNNKGLKSLSDEIKTIELESEYSEAFFDYLNDHLADNGLNSNPLFQPQSRSKPGLPDDKARLIQRELLIPMGDPKWRRAWIAIDENKYDKNDKDTWGKSIVGHIDLRSHGSRETKHRALLGMGAHRAYRRNGIGTRLLNAVVDWIREIKVIEYIDLWVLSNNQPAINFYEKVGFQRLGEVEDMFRIDGQPEGQLLMSKRFASAEIAKT